MSELDSLMNSQLKRIDEHLSALLITNCIHLGESLRNIITYSDSIIEVSAKSASYEIFRDSFYGKNSGLLSFNGKNCSLFVINDRVNPDDGQYVPSRCLSTLTEMTTFLKTCTSTTNWQRRVFPVTTTNESKKIRLTLDSGESLLFEPYVVDFDPP